MICISVVSHRQGHLVAGLLEDLQRLNVLDPSEDEIVVTLNVPEEVGFLDDASALPVRVIRNCRPKGFGENHNAALRTSNQSIFAVVNPDVRLHRFDKAAMLDSLSDTRVGLWAPQVRSSQGIVEDSARRFPTVLRLASRTILRRRKPDYVVESDPISVDWVAGMFMVLRCETFLELGGFDERYFMYMEDADLCRRIGRLNMKVILDPRVHITHDAQRASRRNWQHMRWHYRSAARFLFRI